MGTKSEVNEMLDALEGSLDAQTDAPTTKEPPSTDQPPDTSAPADVETDPPVTDEPETKPPKTEPPTTDAPVDDDLETIRKENEELRKKIDEMSAPKTKPPLTTAPVTDPPIEDVDFLKDADLDELTRDPAEFNKLLNEIRRGAIEIARSELKAYGQKVPQIIDVTVSTQEKLRKMSDEFYENNPDLTQFKKVVGVVFNELVQENPDSSYEEVLNKVGDEARKRLELKKPTDKVIDKNNPPKLPKRKQRVRQREPELSKVSKEIDDMNKALNQ